MKIKVLYFSHLKMLMGQESGLEEVESGCTVGVFRSYLESVTGLDKSKSQTIRALVNGAYGLDQQELKDGDELAWVPLAQPSYPNREAIWLHNQVGRLRKTEDSRGTI